MDKQILKKMEEFNEPVIATRPLIRRRPDGVEVLALVEIGTPFQHPGIPGVIRAGEWSCRLRLTGFGHDQTLMAAGADSVQALVHAICLAGTLVTASKYAAQLISENMPNHGFPVLPEMPAREDLKPPRAWQ